VFNYSLDGLLAGEGTGSELTLTSENREPNDPAYLDFIKMRTRTSWAASPTKASPRR
jgi:hypothetical protein